MLITWVAWIIFFFHLPSFALQSLPTLDVASITLDDYPIVLENQTKIIGLQNALNSEFGGTNQSLAVFSDACKQPDGTFNCTAACLDNTQLFSDLKTLHNCVVFPNISLHLANNTLSPDARRLADHLNIEPSGNESLLPSRISNAIQHCLIDSCNNITDCKLPRNSPLSPANLTGTAFISDDYFNPCSQITAHINADVGGVGVCPQSARSALHPLTLVLGFYFLRHADGLSIARVHRYYSVVVNRQRNSQLL